MSSFLASLPHQIPFRAASGAAMVDDQHARGIFLCSGGDALGPLTIEVMIVEALAQVGGLLAFRQSAAPGMLVALDEVRIHQRPSPGDRLDLEVNLDASFAGIHRLRGTATLGENVVAEARFHLAAAATGPVH